MGHPHARQLHAPLQPGELSQRVGLAPRQRDLRGRTGPLRLSQGGRSGNRRAVRGSCRVRRPPRRSGCCGPRSWASSRPSPTAWSGVHPAYLEPSAAWTWGTSRSPMPVSLSWLTGVGRWCGACPTVSSSPAARARRRADRADRARTRPDVCGGPSMGQSHPLASAILTASWRLRAAVFVMAVER